MIITILAEPRSGSTNLTNWFYFNKDFTTLFEPENTGSKWYQKGIKPKDYKYNTKHLCIKEIYYPNVNWDSLLQVSDKIIILYREKEQEQIESWVNAKKTNNWHNQWKHSVDNFILEENQVIFFKELKKLFTKQYVNNLTYFKISYEELYYDNGFQKIVDYLDLDCVKNINFPYGQKYRIDTKVNKLI